MFKKKEKKKERKTKRSTRAERWTRSVRVLVIRAAAFNPRIIGVEGSWHPWSRGSRKSVCGEATQIARPNENVSAEKCAAGGEVTQTPLMACPVIPERHSRLTPFLRRCQETRWATPRFPFSVWCLHSKEPLLVRLHVVGRSWLPLPFFFLFLSFLTSKVFIFSLISR